MVGSFFVLVFAVVGFASTAAAHTPNDPLWLRLGGLDLFVHGIAGEAELVECQSSHPVGGAHVLGVPHVALDFRHAEFLARRSPAGW
ncbi:hypothetical protein D3C84_413490 [compost metagenome]